MSLTNPALNKVLKQIASQGVTRSNQNLQQPQTSSGVANPLDVWEQFKVARAAPPKPRSMGGIFGKVLGVIDFPRAVLTSGLKETIDLFQGEGFNFGEFADQTKRHYGFGDLIREENIDLGKWGNRIAGFVGDVALDPLSWAGGLGAFARARGTKGLIDDLTPLYKDLTELKKLGRLKGTQAAQLRAVDDAIKAAGQKRSVSAARNVLIRNHGDIGKKLVDDLGIETGLRWRVPGTGPVLGRMSRGSTRAARKRAGQIPEVSQQRLKTMGWDPSKNKLEDLVFASQSKKRLKDLPQGLSGEARGILRMAAKAPVDALPIGVFPLGSGVAASIMSGPGLLYEKVATTKGAQSFKKVFVDPMKSYEDALRRSGSPAEQAEAFDATRRETKRVARNLSRSRDADDIILSQLVRSANNRSSMGTGALVENFNKRSRQTENLVRRTFPKVNDDTLGRIADEPDILVWEIQNNQLRPEVAARLANDFPNLSLQEIADVKTLLSTQIDVPDLEFLLRKNLYPLEVDDGGNLVGKFINDVDDVLNDYGGYEPMILTPESRDMFRVLFGDDWAETQVWARGFDEVLDEAIPEGMRASNMTQVQRRGRAEYGRQKTRGSQPSRITREGVPVQGIIFKIPLRDSPGQFLEVKLLHPGGQRPGAPQRGLGFNDEGVATVITRNLIPAEQAARARSGNLVTDPAGRSIARQIDDAFREAGWLEAGESLWKQGFAAKRAAYTSGVAADARLRLIEMAFASKGIVFNADTYLNMAEKLEALEVIVRQLDEELAAAGGDRAAAEARLAAREKIIATIQEYKAKHFDEKIDLVGEWGRTVDELIESDAELIDLSDELVGMIREINEKLGRVFDRGSGGGTPAEVEFGDLLGFPLDYRRGGSARYAINAVEVLGPIMADLEPVVVRLAKIKQAIAYMKQVREDLTEALEINTGFDELPDGLAASEFIDDYEAAEFIAYIDDNLLDNMQNEVEFIEDTLLPYLKDVIDDTMMRDRTVEAVTRISDAVDETATLSATDVDDLIQIVGKQFNDAMGLDVGNSIQIGGIPFGSASSNPILVGPYEKIPALNDRSWSDIILASDHPMKERMVAGLDSLHQGRLEIMNELQELVDNGVLDQNVVNNILNDSIITIAPESDDTTWQISWSLFGSHNSMGSSAMRALKEHGKSRGMQTLMGGLFEWLDSTFLYAADRAGRKIGTSASGNNDAFIRNDYAIYKLSDWSDDLDSAATNAGEDLDDVALIRGPEKNIAPVADTYTVKYIDMDGVEQPYTVDLPGAGTSQETLSGPAWADDETRAYFSPRNVSDENMIKPDRVLRWERVTGEVMTQDIRMQIFKNWETHRGDLFRITEYGRVGFRNQTGGTTLSPYNAWVDESVVPSVMRQPTKGLDMNQPDWLVTDSAQPLRGMQGGLWRKNAEDFAVPAQRRIVGKLRDPDMEGTLVDGRPVKRRAQTAESELTPPEFAGKKGDVESFNRVEAFVQTIREFGEIENALQTNYLNSYYENFNLIAQNLQETFESLQSTYFDATGDITFDQFVGTMLQRMRGQAGDPSQTLFDEEVGMGFGVRQMQDVIELDELIQRTRGEVSDVARRSLEMQDPASPTYNPDPLRLSGPDPYAILPDHLGGDFTARRTIVVSMDEAQRNIVERLRRLEASMAEKESKGLYWRERMDPAVAKLEAEEKVVLELLAKEQDVAARLIIAEDERIGMLQSINAEFGTENGLAFNLNSFGGEFVPPQSAKELRDMFNLSSRQMWGNFLITGDEYMADSVIDSLLAAQKMNDREAVGKYLRAYDRVHNWMKAQMVATPGFVLRNIFGGMSNMWFADIPLEANIKTAYLMNRVYKAGEGDFDLGLNRLIEKNPNDVELQNAFEIRRAGGDGGGQAASTVDVNLGQPGKLDYIVGSKDNPFRQGRITLNPADSGFVMFSAVRHANTFAEQMMRLGTGLHVMNVGGDLDEALEMIYKLHFNYGGLSSVEQKFGKRFFPFYTWTRKNFPLQMELLARNPGKFNRLMSIKRNLEMNEEKEGMVPDYFLENFNIQLPWKVGGATTYAAPDLPLQDLFRFDPSREGGGAAMEQIFSGATPFFKTPIEYWADKKLFAGIPYQDEFVKLPVAFRVIPGMTTSLKMLGWGDKNAKGEGMVNDKKLGILENMLPFIGRLRRIIPEDEKTQETWIQTMMSTLGGVSVRINTPRRQRSEEIRRSIAKSRERDVWKSFENR